MKLITICMIAATLFATDVSAPAAEPDPMTSSTLPPDHPNFTAWRARRFGLFIHWGPVSLKGVEIGWDRLGERRDLGETNKGSVPAEEYDNLYKQFNPVKFNADQWVSIAKAAGMKYMVLIAKHHDGFCMFDSKLTDYKITNTPFKRDVTAELATACRKAGLSFGLYYSPPDWHHPDFFTANHARYVDYMHGQVREILSNYGPIDEIWFDSDGGINKPETWNNPPLFKMIRQLQPQAVVTTRCGGDKRRGVWGDFYTPEGEVGEFNTQHPWETCMTLCHGWSWHPNDKMKSLKECMDALLATVGGDGNFLFDVGPEPTGEIEARQVERLKEMGEWLGHYGESVYETRGGPIKPTKNCVTTRKGNVIYVHVLAWPEGRLTLPALPLKVTSASVLTGGKVAVEQTAQGVTLSVPPENRQQIDTLIKLEMEGNVMGIAPIAAVSAAQPDFSTYKTFGTMGKEAKPLSVEKEAELFRYEGKGCLTHMWFGGEFKGVAQTRIRVYVDGEEKPSIAMELYLGHGIGFSDDFAPWGIARIGKAGAPNSVYNTYRIPFGKSIRVTGQLGPETPGQPLFWWIIRGTENLPVELGGVRLPDNARLHLHKLENYTAKPLEEFALCDVPGNGALFQVTMAAKGQRKSVAEKWKDLSFMEACMRAYIGGAKEPLMLSSGLEDYFLGTYYFNKGRYATPVAGLTHFNAGQNEFSAYRFHEDDPVFFQHGLRLTCRCGEKIGDKVYGDPPETSYTTYVWTYNW